MTAECCMKVFDQKNLSLQEAGLVSIQAVREYVSVLWGQYQVAGRRLRSQILDELERNLGIHRKSANRLMLAKRAPPLGRGKGNRKRIYCSECIKLLRRVWREMCYCNSKLLKAGLKDWLPFIDNVDESIKNKLMKMASSTMDIYLKSQRSSLRRRLNTGTKCWISRE